MVVVWLLIGACAITIVDVFFVLFLFFFWSEEGAEGGALADPRSGIGTFNGGATSGIRAEIAGACDGTVVAFAVGADWSWVL